MVSLHVRSFGGEIHTRGLEHNRIQEKASSVGIGSNVTESILVFLVKYTHSIESST